MPQEAARRANFTPRDKSRAWPVQLDECSLESTYGRSEVRVRAVILVMLTILFMLEAAAPALAVDRGFYGEYEGSSHRISGPRRNCGGTQQLHWRVRRVNARTRHIRSFSGRYSLTVKYRSGTWQGDRTEAGWSSDYNLRYHSSRDEVSGRIVQRYGTIRCVFDVDLSYTE
jgi:hypothetical protein